MSKIFLAAGAAALAIAAPALADKGGHGGGNGGGHGAGNGGGKGGQAKQAERGGHGGGQAMQVDRGHGGGHGDGNEMHSEIRQAHNDGGQKMHGNQQREMGRAVANHDAAHVINADRGRFVSRNFDDGFQGFANACPPGLDKKGNGCLPPGQATKFLGARLQNSFANSLLPNQYRSWYRDDNDHFYRSGDGYIYRVSRNNDLVDGIIPLFGGGGYYAVGDQWPASYDFYNVPDQYRNYYADSGDYRYRYGDGAIYRLNSGSGAVDSIVALLAGDLGVGQRLPLGYDTYNVPFSYRDRYADTADNWYRYNDGYIYQVDPKTRLISAVINAIV